jgi:hypothetical protein
MEHVKRRYRDERGNIPMASCCGGDSTLATIAANAVRGVQGPAAQEMGDHMVRVEFLGPEKGSISLQPRPGRVIRLGNNTLDRYADMSPEEAAWVAERLNVRIVPQFDDPGPPDPLQPIVKPEDVLTPDAPQRALRPRGRPARVTA